MAFITLAVTTKVLQEVKAGHGYQRQIAIRGASPELLAIVRKATANNLVPVAVNGVFDLSVGDTGAIWEKHQSALQIADFTSLYGLLARRPDRSVKFTWHDASEGA